MDKRIILYLAISILAQSVTFAQYYNTGQDPQKLKWEEINSEHFRILYPESYKNEALNTAKAFENSYLLLKGMYGEKTLKKFPVIIHNHTVESNGYVSWAPKRVELYPFPGQNSIPMSHRDQLALHELVHALQMQSLRNGFSRPMEFLFGEQYAGATSMFAPFWFLEGDAVVSETVFSESGRGRQPDFEKELKAILLEQDSPYSYDKMINGSYRNFTPDHYRFGYQMAAYARAEISPDLFNNAMNYTAKRPWSLNPFNFSMKKDAGITKKGLYSETMLYLEDKWRKEEEALNISKFKYLSQPSSKEYRSYNSPQITDENEIVALKTSFTDPPHFVLLSDKGEDEKKIFTPGIIWPYYFSYSSGILTWSEHYPDPRWENREFSVIKTYSIKEKVMKQISFGTRLFSPSLSNNGLFIVAVESTPEFKNSIIILNRHNGAEIQRISTPENVLPVFPVWDNNDRKIVFITFSDKGEGIMTCIPDENSFETILDPSRNDLQSVAIRNDSVFYTSSLSGIDNAYLITPKRKISRLTSSRFGISNISLNSDEIVFSDYSVSGERAASYKINDGELVEVNKNSLTFFQADKIKSSAILEYDTDTQIPDTYTIKPYKKWQHLFNIHSWMPFYADVNNITFDNLNVSPGVTLMSQNQLSTLTSSLAYEYRDGNHLLHSNLSWRGWYPGIDLDISYGGIPEIYQDDDGLYYPNVVSTGLSANGNIYLPLRFRTGKFSQTLWPSINISYNNSYVFEEGLNKFDNGQVMVSGRFYFSNLHRMSARDIWPRWGQVIDMSYTKSPGDEEIYGAFSALRSTFYIPSPIKNQGIRLKAQFQNQQFEKLIKYNKISLARGYYDIVSSKLKSYSADYTIPLLYPDINIGGILYLNRIRTSLFYDYSVGTDNYHLDRQEMVHEKELFTSYGAELLADFYLFRIPFRFSGGGQFAWLHEKREPYFRLLLTINVFGFVVDEK